MFHVGQKVVCIGSNGTAGIDWNTWAAEWKVVRPERGLVYTVRDIRVGASGRGFIRLNEIVNPAIEWLDAPNQEPWWWASAFRPVVERKTDISVFTALLNTEKTKEPA